MKKTITAAGILIIIYMLLSCLITNFALGKLLGIILGSAMALWFHVPDNAVVKVSKIFFIIIAIFFIIIIVMISVLPHTNRADYTEEAVIVLGCGVKGTKPGGSLIKRLDKTIEYYNNNNKAVIVVSGGKGPQEDISEAQAMYDYLIERGLPSQSMIMESKATSTNDNFRYSKEILDKRLGEDYRAVYITNGFHSYRAGELAKLNGLNVRSYNAKTPLSAILPSYLREVLAVLKLWIFKK